MDVRAKQLLSFHLVLLSFACAAAVSPHVSRVREAYYYASLPSEPCVRVSPHTAQAFQTLWLKNAPATTTDSTILVCCPLLPKQREAHQLVKRLPSFAFFSLQIQQLFLLRKTTPLVRLAFA